MLVTVQTTNGPRKVRVCDYCKTVCIPSGRFCSGYCARGWDAQQRLKANLASRMADDFEERNGNGNTR